MATAKHGTALSSPLLARKGEARPAMRPERAGSLSHIARVGSTLRLRLGRERRRKLELAEAIHSRSAQQLVIQALDALLNTLPEVEAPVAHLPLTS